MENQNTYEESYECIFGKGILLFAGLSYLLFLFIGGYNVSWQGMDTFKVWHVAGIVFFYMWHFKLVLDDNINKITPSFNLMLNYSIMNIFVATGFSAQYLVAFAMYQGLLINGYTGSIYYKGLTLLKSQILEGNYQELAKNILEKKEKQEKSQV